MIVAVDEGLGHTDKEESFGVGSGGDGGKVVDVVMVRVADADKEKEESAKDGKDSQWCRSEYR